MMGMSDRLEDFWETGRGWTAEDIFSTWDKTRESILFYGK